MASLTCLPCTLPTVSPSSSSSSCTTCLVAGNPKRGRFGLKNSHRRQSFALTTRAAVDGVSGAVDDVSSAAKGAVDDVTSLGRSPLKLKLLSAVAGLNNGLAASEDDLRKADAAAKELEAAGGPVDLSTDLDKLQGRWKLVYSSAFSSRTLGGSRPGPPIGRLLPISLGQVFQRIDIVSKDFDNIVEVQLGAPWPLPPIDVTATLAHKFELIGTARVKIKFDKTTVKTTGSLSQLPPLEIPRIPDGLRPSSNPGSGEFEVTYVDTDTRITRGDRDELRVFVIA
ncbi:plastid-lipid-associated protein 6, chloroplastic [Rosa rugosa]|uniref:plastid-lipid-associated protein 6, chloroplastic n=1 Tax=Rosa rugosa TaxID=74645 RepID=UPI002B40DA60|nr:plastid-lipid-associated protein 6, chloroplastic [Rosa rugosa]